MTVRVLLVAAEGAAREAYLDAIKPLGVEVTVVSSFAELHGRLKEKTYSGVMVDLKTKVKAPDGEKQLVHEILEQFPMVQLTLEKGEGAIKALYFGQASEGGSLEAFINEECRDFQPRAIRADVRMKIHFNLELSRDRKFSEEGTHRSVTIDVSSGGCFIYSVEDWELGDLAHFRIMELGSETHLTGEVRWRRVWGTAMQIPGIGVQFETVTKNQLKGIIEKGRL